MKYLKIYLIGVGIALILLSFTDGDISPMSDAQVPATFLDNLYISLSWPVLLPLGLIFYLAAQGQM